MAGRKPGRRTYHTEGTTMFGARIPDSLEHKVSLLLVDPQTGSIPYGAKTQLLETLLNRWVEEQISLRAGSSAPPEGPVFTPDRSRYSEGGEPSDSSES